MIVSQSDSVAAPELFGLGVNRFPKFGIGEIKLREIGLPIGLSEVFVRLSSKYARHDPDLVTLVELLGAVGGLVVPLQTVRASVGCGGPQPIGLGQINALVDQQLYQCAPHIGIGIVGGKLPARGIGIVFFPEIDLGFDLDCFPQIFIIKISIAQIDRGARARVLEQLAHHVAVVVVARHANHVPFRDHAPTSLGRIVLRLTDESINPSRNAARCVLSSQLHRVARFHLVRFGADFLPAGSSGEIADEPQIHQFPVAGELVNPARVRANFVARFEHGRAIRGYVIPGLPLRAAE